MSKNCEKSLKPYLKNFHDQRLKGICLQIVCPQKSCQNTFTRSKIANKRPKRSNSTKIETRVKTSKGLQIAGNRLEVIFVTKYQNKFSVYKKLILDQSRAITALNHLKLA